MAPKKNRGILTYFIIVVLAIAGLYYVTSKLSDSVGRTNYTTVIEHFDNLEVSAYELDLGSGELTYKLDGEDKEYEYTVPNVSLFVNEVLGSDAENYRKQ